MRLLPMLDIPIPGILPLSTGSNMCSKSRVTALTQNHPFGTLETHIANGNNVAHNLVMT